MKNKLSKAQQEVVDKMREGWELRFNPTISPYYLLDKKILHRKNTTYEVFQSLFEAGVIKFDYADGRILVYQLTEKYRKHEA